MLRTKAYSLDLREKAISLLREGKSYSTVSTLLKISPSTLLRWKHRPKLERSPCLGSKPRDLGIELETLLTNNPGKTLAQLAQLLPINKSSLRVRLKKAGFTCKNKSYTYTEGNPELQASFMKEIQSLDPSTVYHLDESGFEARNMSEKGWAMKGERIPAKKKETVSTP